MFRNIRLRALQAVMVAGFAITKDDILIILNILLLVIGLIIDYLKTKKENEKDVSP